MKGKPVVTVRHDYRSGHTYGTAWTDAGRGATVGELLDAFERYRMPSDVAPARLATHKRSARTNLLLTGEGCDEYDLEKIRAADCEGAQDEGCACWSQP